jgi:hypothetical protein
MVTELAMVGNLMGRWVMGGGSREDDDKWSIVIK